MKNAKNYILLHLNILIFSFTGVFSKAASEQFKLYGLKSYLLYLFLGLMFLNCMIYAVIWQKVIKKIDLSVAYANKTVYLIWSQIWAVLLFNETLSVRNIIGLILVFIGVLVVQRYE
ncbi:MAG: EamA family transporter [Eubacteriales bacterium]|nr:EamA family transporter [Eubacteriales bacterium]